MLKNLYLWLRQIIYSIILTAFGPKGLRLLRFLIRDGILIFTIGLIFWLVITGLAWSFNRTVPGIDASNYQFSHDLIKYANAIIETLIMIAYVIDVFLYLVDFVKDRQSN